MKSLTTRDRPVLGLSTLAPAVRQRTWTAMSNNGTAGRPASLPSSMGVPKLSPFNVLARVHFDQSNVLLPVLFFISPLATSVAPRLRLLRRIARRNRRRAASSISSSAADKRDRLTKKFGAPVMIRRPELACEIGLAIAARRRSRHREEPCLQDRARVLRRCPSYACPCRSSCSPLAAHRLTAAAEVEVRLLPAAEGAAASSAAPDPLQAASARRRRS